MLSLLSSSDSAALLRLYYIICCFSLSAVDPPEDAPEMFEAVAGQRQVNFSWSPPPVIQHNGVITSYTLSCSPSPSSLPQSPSQSGTLTVTGFSPDTSYTCSLVASNSQGSGPAANISFTTLEDCKIILLYLHNVAILVSNTHADTYFQLHLAGVLTCSELIVSTR